MSGRPPATWLAVLGCGCEAPVPGEPEIGTYLSCINDIRHQTSYRINGARPIAFGGEAADSPVQLALFGVAS